MCKTFILSLLLLLFGCSRVAKTSNEIVIIVNNPPQDFKFKSAIGLIYSLSDSVFMSYLDDSLRLTKLYAKNSCDTLVIPTTSDFVEFRYRYHVVESRYFMLKKGDTVDIRFNTLDEPYFSSRTNKEFNVGYNFFNSVEAPRLKYNLYPNTLKNSLFLSVAARLKEIDPENFQKEYHKDYIDPDTLQDAVSAFENSFMKKHNNDSLTIEQKNWLEYQYKLMRVEDDGSELMDDSFVNYISYYDFQDKFLDNYRNAKKIPSPASLNGIFKEKGGERCSEMLFDSLYVDNSIPPKTKLMFLESTLRDIYSATPYLASSYADKFDLLGGNSAKIKSEFIEIGYKDFATLELEDADGQKMTLQDVLDKNRGKVVYLDFWGTHCAPCIESMPDAAKLRKKLAGEDIVFLFVALWDKKGWEKIIGSDDNYQSYFSTNSRDSKMLEDLEVHHVPRYMLFDKEGNLIAHNALTPHHPSLSALLLNQSQI